MGIKVQTQNPLTMNKKPDSLQKIKKACKQIEMDLTIIVRRGVVEFRIGDRWFHHTFYNTDFVYRNNLAEIGVRFDQFDLDSVDLFSMEGEYLLSVWSQNR
jgi:hypothetical protein